MSTHDHWALRAEIARLTELVATSQHALNADEVGVLEVELSAAKDEIARLQQLNIKEFDATQRQVMESDRLRAEIANLKDGYALLKGVSKDAILEEAEACAQIVDGYAKEAPDSGERRLHQKVARAIRKRAKK